VPIGEHQRREIREEHLLIRLALTLGGATVALAGSFMNWSHGLTDSSGPVTDGGIAGDGRYTALLAVAVIGCTLWSALRSERAPALATAAASAALFLVGLGEWNSVSDSVESENRSAGLFATASVAPGIWLVLLGALVALVGAVWSARIER
jgi:hypothetical protein